MVEAQVKDTAQNLVHRERLERDILGRVRTARLDTSGTSPHVKVAQTVLNAVHSGEETFLGTTNVVPTNRFGSCIDEKLN